jgi:cytochrome c oxidase assembly protein subunit 11
MDQRKLKRRNLMLGASVIGVAGLMVGFAFAAVPLYRVVCEKLGWDGTPQRAAEASKNVTDIPVTVRFDANIEKALPWKFQPMEKSVTLKLGETKTVFYRATNTSDRPATGTATFNVTPDKTGQYFNKLECFCFQEQTLQPGQSVDMGVTFFVDPKMATDVNTEEVRTITLSYTFFKSMNGAPQSIGDKDSAAAANKVKLTAAPASGAASVN